MGFTVEGFKKFCTEGLFPSGTDRYLHLHTAAPTAGNVIAWSSYDGLAISNGEITIDPTTPFRAKLNAKHTFDATNADGTDTITHWGIWEAEAMGTTNNLLFTGQLTTSRTPTAGQTVEFAANALYLDGDIANSPITYQGWLAGITGAGIIGGTRALALFSDDAMTTELSGNGYARVTGLAEAGWNFTSAGVLRLTAAKEFPAASGSAWTAVQAIGVMSANSGGNVLFGGNPSPDGTSLTVGQKFTLAANVLTLTRTLEADQVGT